jgi:hypothetical protein
LAWIEDCKSSWPKQNSLLLSGIHPTAGVRIAPYGEWLTLERVASTGFSSQNRAFFDSSPVLPASIPKRMNESRYLFQRLAGPTGRRLHMVCHAFAKPEAGKNLK